MNDILTMRTDLANQFAAAGAKLLDFTMTAGALAAIPNTTPQQYAVAGTLDSIQKVLPAAEASHPQRRQKHGDRPSADNISWEDDAAPVSAPIASTPEPELQQLKALADDEIIRVWQEMPGGADGWLKLFGYLQFARAIESKVAARIERGAAPAPVGTKEFRDAIRNAVITCGHKIEDGAVTLFHNPKFPGNAFSQLLDRIELAASPATASGDELPRLQKAYDIMHTALCDISQPADAGCGCAFPCRCNDESAEALNAKCMRDLAVDALSEAESVIDFGETVSERAAVSAATKPTADLPEDRLDYIVRQYFGTEQLQNNAKDAIDHAFKEVRSLLATKPAAAPTEPVAWMRESDKCCVSAADKKQMEGCEFGQWATIAKRYTIPLYAAPMASDDAVIEAKEMAAIGKLIVEQDNRITDQPMFVVQQRRRITGLDTDYCDNIIWMCSEDEYNEASEEEAAQLEAEYQETGRARSGWVRTGYMDQWEFVTACFTEQGCKEYLVLDGHNLKEPRIYAEGSYRNEEFRAIRKFLIGLRTKAAGAEGAE